MSRRRNGTNRAGSSTGGGRYQGGYNRTRKCTAGAGTSSGATKNDLQTNCNIEISEEQERMDKVIYLIHLAISINGLECRSVETTGSLPTVFVRFAGHVSMLEIRVYTKGWDNELKSEVYEVHVDDHIGLFNDEFQAAKHFLLDIKEGMTT